MVRNCFRVERKNMMISVTEDDWTWVTSSLLKDLGDLFMDDLRRSERFLQLEPLHDGPSGR